MTVRDKQDKRRWQYAMPKMEGRIARWYDRQRGSDAQLEFYRDEARLLTAGVPASAAVLEVAPGPGYLAIEIARLGYAVTGLEISDAFVQIATEHARAVGVDVDFQHGDAADLPFDSESYDLIICQAAFKNFREPVKALDEMHRVLRPGGVAIIQDLSRDASNADITHEVRRMELSAISALATRLTLTAVRLRAYSGARFERLAAESAFHGCEVHTEGIGVEVRLQSRPEPE